MPRGSRRGMLQSRNGDLSDASELAICVRDKYVGHDRQAYQPLTFGELPVGAWYIALPVPEEKGGSSWLRATYPIHEKTKKYASPSIPRAEDTPNSRRLDTGEETHMHAYLPVVRVQGRG